MTIPIEIPDAPVRLIDCIILPFGGMMQWYQSKDGTRYLCVTTYRYSIHWYKIVP